MWNVQAPVQAGVFLYDTTQLKTMTQQHPITPPPELVQQWEADWHCSGNTNGDGFTRFVATCAAQWGADMELAACCRQLTDPKWYDEIKNLRGPFRAAELRAARRPKPQTLNSIALQMLGTIERDAHYLPEITDTIRRALNQLSDS
jgi:hypothetical protein